MSFVRNFASENNKTHNTMKVKLTKAQIQAIVDDPEKAAQAGVKAQDPWWVIVLKVISYVISLILAGVATASCAHAINII